MKSLKLEHIRLDGGTQARVALNNDVVDEYAAHLKEGDTFPNVVVFNDGSDNWLADGYHRYMAHKKNGLDEIKCDVKTGTLEDAKLWAYGANGRRGLSLSREDKRNVVSLMLGHPEWGKWTNTVIAKHVGVSSMTVGRIQASLTYESEADKPKKKYKKNGKVQEMDTKNIGRKKSQEPVEDEQIVSELADTVNSLSAENQKLKDAIAIGAWDATEFEKMDVQETIDQLREQIRVLEIDNAALRESRDMFQARNAELMDTVKSLQAKLKK